MAKPLSKSALIAAILKSHTGDLTKRDVKGVLDVLAFVGHKEIRKGGIFVLPGFAKFVVTKRSATKERKGINPFTGQETVFKAKPARKVVKARPLKPMKDAVA